jgi:hypothetical protein
MTLPFRRAPGGRAQPARSAGTRRTKIHSAYRFLLSDLMPFGKERPSFTLEHGGLNQSTEHYRTVAYWYGAPAASLVKTDELDIGDAASEERARYVSPEAPHPMRSLRVMSGGRTST